MRDLKEELYILYLFLLFGLIVAVGFSIHASDMIEKEIDKQEPEKPRYNEYYMEKIEQSSVLVCVGNREFKVVFLHDTSLLVPLNSYCKGEE